MNRLLFLALAVVMSLAVVVAVASSKKPADGASGSMSLTVHAHSSQFGGPGGNPLLAGTTDPLEFPVEEGGFSYSSVTCEDPARFNDVALSFDPDYPGIEDPAPVRHIVEGEVTDFSGKTGTVQGTITTFLCQGNKEADRIDTEFEGTIRLISDNELRLTGTYEITGGTGRFSDLSGEGTITGELTCLPTTLERTGADSCADLGAFSDAVFSLQGEFSDPTAPR